MQHLENSKEEKPKTISDLRSQISDLRVWQTFRHHESTCSYFVTGSIPPIHDPFAAIRRAGRCHQNYVHALHVKLSICPNCQKKQTGVLFTIIGGTAEEIADASGRFPTGGKKAHRLIHTL